MNIAHEIDRKEREIMAEGGTESEEYQKFVRVRGGECRVFCRTASYRRRCFGRRVRQRRSASVPVCDG